MIVLQKIHEFAYRWYHELKWNAEEPIDVMIAECEDIGLKYDPSVDHNSIFFSLFDINDPIVIAKAVYMKLLAYKDGEPEEKIISWLKKSLDKLMLLSDPKMTVFESTIKRIKIFSHIGFFDYHGDSHDIESQSVTLTNTGKAYVYQRGVHLVGHPIYRKMKVCAFDKEALVSITAALKKYLEETRLELHDDAGYFMLEVENIDSVKVTWAGSLGYFDHYVSELIREALGLRYLMLLDGLANWNVVDKIKLEYWHIDKEYKEIFHIDRKNKELRIKRLIDSRRIEDISISDSIDIVDALDILSNPPDYPKDAAKSFAILDSDSTNRRISSTWPRRYRIDLYKQDGRTETAEGYFEKTTIFNEWRAFAKRLVESFPILISFEIFKPKVMNAESAQDGKVLLCMVFFSGSNKEYSYLTDDETLLQDDEVLVPVGDGGTTAVATIASIQLMDAKDLKYPIDKIKKVIGLYKMCGK